jgi:hypothetical protein
MPLWFMSFGGTVSLGNLIAGPIMDAVGARWVLGAGAIFAVGRSIWANMAHLEPSDFLPVEHGGEPFVPVNANRLFRSVRCRVATVSPPVSGGARRRGVRAHRIGSP